MRRRRLWSGTLDLPVHVRAGGPSHDRRGHGRPRIPRPREQRAPRPPLGGHSSPPGHRRQRGLTVYGKDRQPMGKWVAIAAVAAVIFVYFAHSHAASAAKVAACLTHAGATVKHSTFLEDSLSAAGDGQQVPSGYVSLVRKAEKTSTTSISR